MKKFQLKFFATPKLKIILVRILPAVAIFIFCAVTLKAQDTLKSTGPSVAVTTTSAIWKAHYKAAQRFVPFTLVDKNGRQIPPDEIVKLPNGNSMPAGTYIARLNQLQQQLCLKGLPLGKAQAYVAAGIITPGSTLDGRRSLAPKAKGSLRTQAQLDSFLNPKFQIGNMALLPLGSYTSATDREKVHQSVITKVAPGKFQIKPVIKKYAPPIASRLLKTINETTSKDLHFGSASTFLAGLNVSLTRYAKIYGPDGQHALGKLSEFKISGNGRIYAALFNHSFDVFTTNGEVYVPADSSKKMTAKMIMSVLGTTILNLQENYDIHKIVSGVKTRNFDKSFAVSVPILPLISFYGKVGIKGSVGYTYFGELDRTFIKGEFKPMCNINGYGEVAIGDPIGVGKVGVRGSLVFLNGNVDLTGWFGVYNANSSQIGLGYGYNVSFYIEMLSGKLEVFYEVCVPDWVPFIGGDCTDYSTTLFNWTGFRYSGTYADYRNLLLIDTRPVVAVRTPVIQ